MQAGTQATIVLNAANEIAVASFLDGQIRLTDIADINERTLTQVSVSTLGRDADIDDILAIDTLARRHTKMIVSKMA